MSVCLVGAAASLIDCSGCGGAMAPGEADDAGADVVLADGNATSLEAGDATSSDASADRTATLDAGPEASLDCLYTDATSLEDGDAAGPCPVNPPAAGAPCDVPDYYCEYGTNWWSRCDLLMTCTKGTWQTFDAGGACSQSDAGPSGGACPADTCPPTWAEAIAIDGGPCPAFSCQYPEGDCLCGAGGDGYCPGAGWSCLPAGAGCTAPRPRFGTPCTPDASSPCTMGWGQCCEQSQHCNDQGVWVGDPFSPCTQ